MSCQLWEWNVLLGGSVTEMLRLWGPDRWLDPQRQALISVNGEPWPCQDASAASSLPPLTVALPALPTPVTSSFCTVHRAFTSGGGPSLPWHAHIQHQNAPWRCSMCSTCCCWAGRPACGNCIGKATLNHHGCQAICGPWGKIVVLPGMLKVVDAVGDTIRMVLPMSIRAERVQDNRPQFAGLQVGIVGWIVGW